MITIDYYFTLQSPWSYIGHATFAAMAARHGARIAYRPISLAKIFPETGGLPLARRNPARQRYRMLELQRWVLERRLAMNLHPKHWPFDPGLADRAVIAVARSRRDVETILPRLYAGVFEREEDLADEGCLARLLRAAGLDADTVLREADSDAVRQVYQDNVGLALAAGVFGAPVYVLAGEMFWGQDRLGLLETALSSGRGPFRPDV